MMKIVNVKKILFDTKIFQQTYLPNQKIYQTTHQVNQKLLHHQSNNKFA